MKCKGLFFKLSLIVLGLLITPITFAESLLAAIEFASHTNPDVQIQAKRRLQFDQDLRIAYARFYPVLDLFAEAGRERSLNSNTNGEYVTLTRKDAGLLLTENLFMGFGDINRVRENKYRIKAAALRVNTNSQNVALETAEAYFRVLLSEELVGIAKRNVAIHLKTLNMIRKRSETGLQRRADMVQAEGRYALSQTNFLAEINNYLDAQANYIRVVGHAPDHLIQPRPIDPFLPKTKEQAVLFGLHHQPAMHNALANLTAREFQRRVTLENFYPRIDLILNTRRGDDLDGVKSTNNDDFAIVDFNYNLYRGGADVATTRRAAYVKQEAFEEIRLEHRETSEAVRLAWNALEITRKQLPHLRTHMVKSRETVIAYREQFKLDKRTLVDLLNAENEFFAASIEYARGKTDVEINKYRLLNSMGILLPTLHIPLPRTAIPVKVVDEHPHVIVKTHRGHKVAIHLPHAVEAGHIKPVGHAPFGAPGAQVHMSSALPGGYAIKVGSFQVRLHASYLVARLRSRHYPAYYVPRRHGSRSYFDVHVGPIYNRKIARLFRDKLEQEFHLRGYVVLLHPSKPCHHGTHGTTANPYNGHSGVNGNPAPITRDRVHRARDHALSDHDNSLHHPSMHRPYDTHHAPNPAARVHYGMHPSFQDETHPPIKRSKKAFKHFRQHMLSKPSKANPYNDHDGKNGNPAKITQKRVKRAKDHSLSDKDSGNNIDAKYGLKDSAKSLMSGKHDEALIDKAK